MKLQEQISRIQSMMRVNEDSMKIDDDSRIGNMFNQSLKSVGLTSTIKLFGGYKELKDYFDKIEFSRDDKIGFIKYVYGEIGGTSFSEIYENPIHYPSGDETHEEIAYMTNHVVIVDVYAGHEYNEHVGEFDVPYEDLSDNIIDEIFNITLHVAEENEII
jgi:hypothetical protein